MGNTFTYLGRTSLFGECLSIFLPAIERRTQKLEVRLCGSKNQKLQSMLLPREYLLPYA
jgi:hypothetical protein